MGNWRTVRIVGTVSATDLPALRDWQHTGRDWDKFHPLCSTDTVGICGLGDWPAEQIDRVGNLAERNYGVEDVAAALEEAARVAPSLTLKVHCGDDWEDDACIATVTVDAGKVSIGPPEVESVGGIPEGQMRGNFLRALTGQ